MLSPQDPGLPADRLHEELDRLVVRAVDELAVDERVAPSPLRLVLRRYAMTGRADLEGVLGPALARALDASGRESTEGERSAWLVLFVEAATLSHDERVRQAVGELAADAVRDWSVEDSTATVAVRTGSIDACLQAADLCAGDEGPQRLVSEAVDALERVVGPLYRPGEGIGHVIGDRAGTRGDLADQVSTAAALLAAHAWTGRLPYSMLAEELMQFVRRTSWPAERSAFSAELFTATCKAVGVLCRLSALHANSEYINMAVVAEDIDYRSEAELLLHALVNASGAQGAAVAAELGLALADYLLLISEISEGRVQSSD